MGLTATIAGVILVGCVITSLLKTDVGQLGCLVVILLVSGLALSAVALLFGVAFAGGCMAAFL